jgi:phosphoribosyl-AMP cyclohydrolase
MWVPGTSLGMTISTQGGTALTLAAVFRGDCPVSTTTPAHAASDDVEEGLTLRPKFDAAGLLTCVTTDADTGEVLMVAHMNDEALRKTMASGEAWYYSRSRASLWRKGESSGHIQRVVEMRVDCDQDAIWIRVEQTGAACHTGRHSCFYRAVAIGEGKTRDKAADLSFVDADKVFDPAKVYGKSP